MMGAVVTGKGQRRVRHEMKLFYLVLTPMLMGNVTSPKRTSMSMFPLRCHLRVSAHLLSVSLVQMWRWLTVQHSKTLCPMYEKGQDSTKPLLSFGLRG